MANIIINLVNKISNNIIFILAYNTDLSKEDEIIFSYEYIIKGKLIQMKYTENKNNDFVIYRLMEILKKKNFYNQIKRVQLT